MQVANEGKINWVKHRGQCTMEAVLEAIREQVEGDVEQMNRLPRKNQGSLCIQNQLPVWIYLCGALCVCQPAHGQPDPCGCDVLSVIRDKRNRGLQGPGRETGPDILVSLGRRQGDLPVLC